MEHSKQEQKRNEKTQTERQTVFLFLISSVYIIRSHLANKHGKNTRFFCFLRLDNSRVVCWLLKRTFFFSFLLSFHIDWMCLARRCIREPIYIKCVYTISVSLAVSPCAAAWMWLWYTAAFRSNARSFPPDHFSFSWYFGLNLWAQHAFTDSRKYQRNADVCHLFFSVGRISYIGCGASFACIHISRRNSYLDTRIME